MTERFEEAVRQAAQGLGSSAGSPPTYHDAWHRGRRRRLVKRSVLASAGALLFFVALSVNLGRFPGSGTTEIDDVATELTVATAEFLPTPVQTTTPLESPTPLPVPTLDPATASAAIAPTVEPLPSTTSAPAAPTATSGAEPAATSEPPAPTATSVPRPSSTATPSVGPSPEATTAAATAETTPSVTDEVPDGNPEQLPGDGDETAALATQPATGLVDRTRPADAIVLEPLERPGGVPCDVDRDGRPEARCTLKPDYPCTSTAELQPGYDVIDTDGNGAPDTCVAVGLTLCDTVGDDLGDTPCIIEISPAGEPDE